MKDKRQPAQQTLMIILIFTQLIYLALFHLLIHSVNALTALFSVILVLLSGLACGAVMGGVSGLVLALAQIASLAGNSVYGLSLESILPAANLAWPEAVSLASLPVVGLLSGVFGSQSTQQAMSLLRKNRDLEEHNQSLSRCVDHYERSFHDLSRDKVYRVSWDPLPQADSAVESIASLLLSAARTFAAGSAAAKTDSADGLFSLLLKVRPEVVAVLRLDGTVIQYNPCLMALYGYDPGKLAPGLRFPELLLPADADRAKASISRVLEAGSRLDEPYFMNSLDGGFSRLLISPWVSLECSGSPLVLIVRVANLPRSLTDDHSTPAESGRMDPADLARQDLLCLSTEMDITYVSPAVAEMLGESPAKMAAKKISKYVSRRQAARLQVFLNNCRDGHPASLDIEMLPHMGSRTIFRMNAWPAIGMSGRCLGTALLIEDITSTTLVQESLQHRLSMEKLISNISTRFISIRADEMDQEIQNVLSQIGEFEKAEESQVEIRQSRHIHNPVKFHVTARHSAIKNNAGLGYGQASSLDRFETISIPIEIASETLGYFKFFVEQDQNNWFETDLELIGLIGQIIVNALIRKENELRIKLNENRLSTTLHSIGDAVIATDTQGRVMLMNRKAEILTGMSLEVSLFRPIADVFKPVAKPEPVEDDTPGVHNMHRFTETDNSMMLESSDGTPCFISINRSPIADLTGEIYGEVIVFRDVTREKQENDEIRFISYHDKLTGLYNRTFFEEELTRINTPRQYPITLILGDCNGLKIANDIFGHLEGDRLLQTIAGILRKATRHEDIVARWGGDEFAIILPRTDEKAAVSFRDRILQLCREAGNTPIQPSLALGSATNMDGSNDLVGLLKLAEDRMYRHKLMEGKSARSSILMSIEKMVYEKSYETEEHASRLEEISRKVGEAVGLTDFELEELNLLSVLHDMGKIGIPDQILLKPERLSLEEWEIMKKHSEKGYNLAKSTPELNSIADSILHHHEHWDGTGYPSGLRGDEIPRLSRILSIVDAYDVITHARSYKSAQSKTDALREIEKCAGTQFDPELAAIFIRIMQQAGVEESA